MKIKVNVRGNPSEKKNKKDFKEKNKSKKNLYKKSYLKI
jgi:hypothetical protein